MVLEVLYLINIANWRGLIVNLFWNPYHLGIGGNEACDQAATPVLKHGCVTQIPLCQSEIVSLAKEQIEKKTRQSQWETNNQVSFCDRVFQWWFPQLDSPSFPTKIRYISLPIKKRELACRICRTFLAI